MRWRVLWAIFALWAELACVDPVRGASFRGLGYFSEDDASSHATAISWDGGVVVGESEAETAREPFVWTPEGGMKRLDNILTVITPGRAADVSADGSVIVGEAFFDQASSFRWQEAGFALFGQNPSVANGVSADGAVVVGTDRYRAGGGPSPVTGTAYRWTADEGVVPLRDLPGGPDCSRANDVSADGRVIVGVGDCAASFQVEDLGMAVRWGDGGVADPLGYLPGAGMHFSRANGISPEGNAIVGSSASAAGTEPFVWTETRGMVGLGHLPGASDGAAEAVSSLGRFVAGSSGGRAFLWTEHLGMQDVQEMLARNPKIDVEGWTLTSVTAISPDGNYLAGNGRNPNGDQEAWWAELFRFPDDDDDGQVDLDDLNNVRNHFGETGPNLIGDMGLKDGIVDLNDLNYVRNYFGGFDSAESRSVPEPSSLLLAVVAAVSVWAVRRAR